MRRMLIRWLTPLAWRSGDARLARAIRRFADVEADSGWQALQLLYGVDDPALKAEFFALSGRLLKSCRYEEFRELAGRVRPTTISPTARQSRGLRCG